MKSSRMIRFRRLSLVLIIILMMLSVIPAVSVAAPGDVVVEYKYTAGETVSIPGSIVLLNREYYLLSQDAPVKESTLAGTRTYTYLINGDLTADDLLAVSSIPGLTLNMRTDFLQKEYEMSVEFINLPSNDVTQIPDTYLSDFGDGILERSGVEFEVTENNGRGGLPSKYKATVIYRGLVTYQGDVYYAVNLTYSTTESGGAVDQYVIVATYRPVIPFNTGGTGAGGGGNAGTEIQTPQVPTAPGPVEPPATSGSENPDNSSGGTTTIIPNNDTPLGIISEPKEANNISLWVIAGIIGVVAIVGIILFFMLKRKKSEEIE